MPGLDGKGPLNQGPQSGRGLGRCRPAGKSSASQTAETVSDQLIKIDPENLDNSTPADRDEEIMGRGRGGRPRGCGRGQGGGGGAGGGRGRGTKP
ncbi:MAG TPA: hypothetical protein ENN66_06850 [Proteobacteria bacterium]|nr:hypothetical protein [Pseudomonadota bacterium]